MMIPSIRETVEQAIILSLGATSLTRDRVEGVVGELIRQGRVTADEGRAMVERIVSRAVGESGTAAPVSGMIGHIESSLRGAFREAGLVTHGELEDIRVQLAELDHRLRLLESPAPAPAGEEPSAAT